MRAALAGAFALTLTGTALASDGTTQPQTGAAPGLTGGLPFPVNIGGAFELTDQEGDTRTEVDPSGNLQLLFFGYANCEAICSVALPMMAEVADLLAEDGLSLTPVMVTIDPKRDTVETIGAPLEEMHSDFVGLTGTEEELQKVYDLYSVEKEVVFTDPGYGEIFAHGSFIYLLDGSGDFLTIMPPILSVERMVEIVSSYATG
ncbi:MAG: SCO family protein [Pseudomonadota bacterium]